MTSTSPFLSLTVLVVSAAGFVPAPLARASSQHLRGGTAAGCASGWPLPGTARTTACASVTVRSAVHRTRGGEVMAQETAEAVAEGETFEFQAEVSKVMDIIINSLYSDKDIFLRELVSNASDACDKKRFLKLTDEQAGGFNGRIRLVADKAANTLTIEDNGVGMTRKELQNNLGRIAQSGTKKFTEALGSGSDATNLIGQFGVGFYSAFLVADRVSVITKAEGEPQLRWESESANKYTITPDESEPIEGSGTRLVLSLKEDADKYLDDYTMRDMLKKYSEFISFPIELWTEKTEYDTVTDPEAEVNMHPMHVYVRVHPLMSIVSVCILSCAWHVYGMSAGQGGRGAPDEDGATHDQRVGDGQQRQAAVDARPEGGDGRRVLGVLQDDVQGVRRADGEDALLARGPGIESPKACTRARACVHACMCAVCACL